MTLRLSEFNLKSYKEREVLMMALSYYKSYRADDIRLMGHENAIATLLARIADTQCQPGGCDYCSNVEGD